MVIYSADVCHAATVQGQAALMQGRAALTNANANASYLKQLGGYYGALTSGQNMSNDMRGIIQILCLVKCLLVRQKAIFVRHLISICWI